MRLQTIILVCALFTALTTSTLGYTGVWSRLRQDRYHDQLEEAYRIIDQAQLWYLRPLSSNGGGKSFMKLDFNQLGFDVGENKFSLQIDHGEIELQRLRSFHFDMVITGNDGTVLSSRNLSYDTRPTFTVEN